MSRKLSKKSQQSHFPLFMFQNFYCRLKFMQAVGLVVGDDFLVKYNLTIDTDDIIELIRNLTYDWDPENGKVAQYIDFNDYFGTEFAEILGPFGFCNSFNIVDAEELFNLEMFVLNFLNF
jgi:hypothetical protein